MARKQASGKRRVGDGTPGPGRPKGGHNKITGEVRDMVLAALNQVGGVEYLAKHAQETPAAFLALVGKLMPKAVELDAKLEAREPVTIVRLVAGTPTHAVDTRDSTRPVQ